MGNDKRSLMAGQAGHLFGRDCFTSQFQSSGFQIFWCSVGNSVLALFWDIKYVVRRHFVQATNYISGISWPYLGYILGLSGTYFGYILAISGAYDGHIMAISWPYRGPILGISWTYLGHILGTFWAYLGYVLGIVRESGTKCRRDKMLPGRRWDNVSPVKFHHYFHYLHFYRYHNRFPTKFVGK